MKFAIWIFCIALLIAFASAGILPEEQYLPPVGGRVEEQLAGEQPLEETAVLAEDGYRYKTVRKLRHRRDVSELFAQGTLADDGYHYHAPSNSAEPLTKVAQEYLPPSVAAATENKDVSEVPKVSNEYLPPAAAEDTENKETSETPEISREYLPPTEAAATLDVPKFAASEELPSPSDDDAVIIEGPGGESSVLADDGYHYRRIRYKRDVSEIVPSAGYSYEAPADVEEIKSAYIPPAEVEEAIPEASVDEEIVKEYLPPVPEVKEAAPETAELADDGYRYKTVRKLKYRQRRDVSEIVPTTPEGQEESFSEASIEYLPPSIAKEASDMPSETAELAEDGYRYKTIRKLKYRQRRDVSEIIKTESAILDKDGYHYRIPEASQVVPKVSNEYLPPSAKLRELTEEPKEVPSTEAPVVTESTSVVPESTTAVTEAAPIVTETTTVTTKAPSTTQVPAISNEYLPPFEEIPLVKAAVSEVSSTTAAPIVSNQYLPPAEEVAEIKEASEIAEQTAILADDGYHYKVGKRFRLRRDVSEIVPPLNGYAYEGPASTNDATSIYLPPVEVKEAAETNEVPQISNEYIPPAEESKNDAEIIEAPSEEEESAVLADDGYHYKTVRRLKYRTRRDVSEISNPSGYLYATPSAVEEESAALADDGYRYKTIRRLKYRHRRDVSELVTPSAEESAILAEDGYHYKTPTTAVLKVSSEYLPPVKNVAEVKEALRIEPTIAPKAPKVSNEYLPPSEAGPKQASSPVVSNEYLPPSQDIRGEADLIEFPQESTVLADNGYRYKTVRRIRYRHRRDVSELANQQSEGYTYNDPIEIEAQEIQYLAPAEEAAQVKETTEFATLADDGYRYKTVKRIRYRHRV